MKVDLKSYLNARDDIRDHENIPGPVITISRDFGCTATPIATQLIQRIGEESQAKANQHWHIISKEILEEAANTLEVNTTRIERLMESEHENAISSLFSSLSLPYGVSDKRIIETLRDVILHYANDGKAIIIGRGGAYMTKKITHAIHIKLQAPLDWRIKQIQETRNLSKSDATALIAEMDHKRDTWIEHLTGKRIDQSIYDIIFNRHTMDDEMIVDLLITALKNKKLITHDHMDLAH